MKTKEKILQKARELFNREGVSTVSSRNISEALNISYGNLCYHFPKKDDIILQLYHNLQSELQEEVSNLRAEIFRFDFMVRSLRRMLSVQARYKFIYVDLVNLLRRFPELAQHSKQQYQVRMIVCREIYDFLIREGYIKPEKFDGHYDKLVHGVLMLINNWIVDAEIFYSGSENQTIDYYLNLIYRFISSSLTQKGADSFVRVYEDLHGQTIGNQDIVGE